LTIPKSVNRFNLTANGWLRNNYRTPKEGETSMAKEKKDDAVAADKAQTRYDGFQGKGESEKTLLGETVKTKVGTINPTELTLWYEGALSYEGAKVNINPRLDNTVKQLRHLGKIGNDPLTEAEVSEIMTDPKKCRKTSELIKNLKPALQATGQPHDPIYAVPNKDGELVIIEGNCSVVCARQLLAEEDGRFASIPVVVLHPSITYEQVLDLVAQFHLSGRKRWASVNEAHILELLCEMASGGLTQKEIGQRLRLGEKKVGKLLRAFKLMTEYQEAHKDYKESQWAWFWKIADIPGLAHRMIESSGRSAEQKALYDPKYKPLYFGWIKDGKLEDSRDPGHLVSQELCLIDNPTACKMISEDGLRATIAHFSKKRAATNHTLIDQMETLRQDLVKMSAKDRAALFAEEKGGKSEKFHLTLKLLRVTLDEMEGEGLQPPKAA